MLQCINFNPIQEFHFSPSFIQIAGVNSHVVRKPIKFNFSKSKFRGLIIANQLVSHSPILLTRQQMICTFLSFYLNCLPSSYKSLCSHPIWFITKILKTLCIASGICVFFGNCTNFDQLKALRSSIKL